MTDSIEKNGFFGAIAKKEATTPATAVDVVEYQKRIQATLERIWKAYSGRADTIGYNLVILAIPKFPGQIEAVSRNLDVETLVDVLEAFLTQFKANRNGDHSPIDAAGADVSAEEDGEGSAGADR